MAHKIWSMDGNVDRFKQIIHGHIRKNIRGYITRGDIIRMPKGGKALIPMPSRITLPRFRFKNQDDGVGQGDGDEGGNVGDGSINPEDREHGIEVTVPELLDILAKDLVLPNLEPKQNKNLEDFKLKYDTRRNVGPRSLVHKRETLKRAIVRSNVGGKFDPNKLVIEPRDFRYRSFHKIPEPHTQAVVFFLMDISGSLSDVAQEIIRIECFWIEQWIEKFYPKTTIRFCAHDSLAAEVSREDFYTLQSGGGTRFKPTYEFVDLLIIKDYPLEAWNIYLFHWTDGDGLDTDLIQSAVFLRDVLAPKLNLFGYEQIMRDGIDGKLIRRIDTLRLENPKLMQKIRTSQIKKRSQIYKTLKTFFGKK